MKKRIIWVDLIKVIGLSGVILMHIIGNTLNTYGNLPPAVNNIYIFIALTLDFVIPIFVMISGMMLLNKKELSFKEVFYKYILKHY